MSRITKLFPGLPPGNSKYKKYVGKDVIITYDFASAGMLWSRCIIKEIQVNTMTVVIAEVGYPTGYVTKHNKSTQSINIEQILKIEMAGENIYDDLIRR